MTARFDALGGWLPNLASCSSFSTLRCNSSNCSSVGMVARHIIAHARFPAASISLKAFPREGFVMAKKLGPLSVFLALALIAFPALADRTNVRPGWNLFTTQQDIEFGRVLADDAARTLQLATDSNSNTYIDALG